MNNPSSTFFFFSSVNANLLLFCVALFLLVGCPPPPQKPNLTGNNAQYGMDGYADDTDQNTGPADDYTHPQPPSTSPWGPIPAQLPLTASDGESFANSNSTTFTMLSGKVIAKPGNNTNGTPNARSLNKVKSDFVVTNQVNCQFEIRSSIEATINSANPDEVRHFVMATIFDANNGVVASYQVHYKYKEDGNDPSKINIHRGSTQIAQIADGGTWATNPRDVGPVQPFVLTPGNYTLQFELNVFAQADTEAHLEVIANVNLK